MPVPRALRRLEKDQAVLGEQLDVQSSAADACTEEMKKLKVALYAKFGSAINLDE